MKEIIEKAEMIYAEYENQKKKEGLDYNIFSLLDVERKELETHENMIYNILAMSQKRGMQVSFVKLFLEVMGLPKKFLVCEWSVEREYDIGGGRIDLFFQSKGKEKLCVVVELKIDADDQYAQLKRYDTYCKKNYEDNYRIIYLTLECREATEKSLVGINNDKKILNCSFLENILEWLDKCSDICKEERQEDSFIRQYMILVKKITNEEHMENKVKELIVGSDKIKACRAIAKALEEVKDDIRYELFERLAKKLKKHCIEWDCEYPICKIRDIYVRNKKVSICISVEGDNELIYCVLYYCDEDRKVINSNAFKRSNKQIANTVEEVIAKALKTRITQNQWNAIKIFSVKNSENEKFDFKNFNDACAELGDEEVMKREVNYISSNVLSYIRDIGMALDEVLEDRIE